MMKTHQTALLTLLSIIYIPGSVLAAPDTAYKNVKIEKVPHVRQKPDFCGEACAEMYLRKLGHKITQDDVFNVSGLDPILGRGCYTAELKKGLEALGFEPGPTWCNLKKGDTKGQTKLWKEAHSDLIKGIPSIVCMRTGSGRSATEHFRLLVGYDAESASIIYHEPAENNGAYRKMKLQEFLNLWPLGYGSSKWCFVRMRLKAGKIKAPERTDGFSNADYAQHIMQLKKKIPGKQFNFVIEEPFVVIGNESPAIVRYRAEKTVKWSVTRLKKMYFKKDPDNIIDVWLFKDNPTYRKYTWEIFRDKPDTPYGYSSSEHRALIMNIGTGGGTLVHEIVHPFIASNFPDCPSWLNEGLGSLYEQSQGKGDEIIGLTNWRLAGLQKAIKRKDVPSFKTLTSSSTYGFYSDDPGTNYSQSRYLCYYLQEKGLLTDFYHKFRKNCEKDPTGYNTLKSVLKENDMDKFKKIWEKFVLGLEFS